MNSEINNIYNVSKHIADNKHSTEVNDLLVEELSIFILTPLIIFCCFIIMISH